MTDERRPARNAASRKLISARNGTTARGRGSYPTRSGFPTTAVQALCVGWMRQLDAAKDQLDPVEWDALLDVLAFRIAREVAALEPRLAST